METNGWKTVLWRILIMTKVKHFIHQSLAGHKYTESDDDAMVEGLNLKRSSVSSTVTPEVKKHKGETSVEGQAQG